jgi:putative FmdB family regulatory protein
VPIYEYRCGACDERFDELVRHLEDPVRCPACGSEHPERLLSVFAGVGRSGAAPAPDYSRLAHHRNSGGCAGGACGHRH